MKPKHYLLIVLFTSIIISCNKNKTEQRIVYINTDTIKGELIADTIIYDVIIKNTNPEDYWADECLRKLNREALIDSIFSGIYSERIIAYDFFANTAFSIEDIKENETSFTRDAIGKIQFTEIWHYNSEHTIMNKKVLNMVFGIEQFNELGELKGYKPLFRIYLR